MSEFPKSEQSNDQFYKIQESAEVNILLNQVDRIKQQIDQQKPLRADIWETIQKKLKIDWTYDSNAIEGSTLSRGETAFFIEYGLTIEGKPFKDFLDARNHIDAIDFLYQIIKDERSISQSVIKEINALLLLGVTHTVAKNEYGHKVNKPATLGEYKKLPNHVLQQDGTIHYYVNPLHVASEMSILCEWIKSHMNTLHPAVVASVAHYNMVRIHPFDDGNGRGARMLMNLVLIKNGYPPAIIKMEKRRFYLENLVKADYGEINPFIEFVITELNETQNIIVSMLNTRE